MTVSSKTFPRILSEFSTFVGSLQRWDPSLKVLAEGYAAKCIYAHNPELEDTGENLFVSTGPLDLRDALEKWFLGKCGSKVISFCCFCQDLVETKHGAHRRRLDFQHNSGGPSCVCWTFDWRPEVYR